MRYACPKCQLALRVKTNSVGVESMADFGGYQYFHADLWSCPSCGLEIIAGFGAEPIVEHYMTPQYSEVIETEKKFTPVFQVWTNKREKEEFESRGCNA